MATTPCLPCTLSEHRIGRYSTVKKEARQACIVRYNTPPSRRNYQTSFANYCITEPCPCSDSSACWRRSRALLPALATSCGCPRPESHRGLPLLGDPQPSDENAPESRTFGAFIHLSVQRRNTRCTAPSAEATRSVVPYHIAEIRSTHPVPLSANCSLRTTRPWVHHTSAGHGHRRSTPIPVTWPSLLRHHVELQRCRRTPRSQACRSRNDGHWHEGGVRGATTRRPRSSVRQGPLAH